MAPKGSSFLGLLIAVALGGIIGAGIACLAGWICSTGGGGDGGGSTVTLSQNQCTSSPNACGLVSIGTAQKDGSCSATPPDNSTCPTPTINSGNGFTASPSTVGLGGKSTLTWNSSNTTACSIQGDNGFSSSGGSSGSVSVGPLAQTAVFTLTCEDGAGGPTATASVRIIVDPHYKEI